MRCYTVASCGIVVFSKHQGIACYRQHQTAYPLVPIGISLDLAGSNGQKDSGDCSG